eukprot:5995957-Pleurochrysis_carterae.AAC.1
MFDLGVGPLPCVRGGVLVVGKVPVLDLTPAVQSSVQGAFAYRRTARALQEDCACPTGGLR